MSISARAPGDGTGGPFARHGCRNLRRSWPARRNRIGNPVARDRLLLSERRRPGDGRAGVLLAHGGFGEGLRRLGAEGARALGQESTLVEMAPEGRETQNRAERATRRANWIAIPGFVAGMIGIAGGGYCDNVAGRSARAPVPSLGLTYPANYKGSTRYVTRLDAKICDASFPIGFAGMGIFVLTGLLYRAKFGKSLG